MNPTTQQDLYNKAIAEFGLSSLEEHERDEMLRAIVETIQKQFLFSVHKSLKKEEFDALEASASMGAEFYATTLKHLVPNYEELFGEARAKVLKTVLTELTKDPA
ncbi:MAG: hypothetical protein QG653_159 [Patescibacteria group bacterium]|nr:hypothetical protein [Patescibacteria group bacterium]